MVLDAVLASPEMRWLGTASEKVAYFTAATSLQIDQLRHLTFGVEGGRSARSRGSRRSYATSWRVLCAWMLSGNCTGTSKRQPVERGDTAQDRTEFDWLGQVLAPPGFGRSTAPGSRRATPC